MNVLSTWLYNDFNSNYTDILKNNKHNSLYLMRPKFILELVFKILQFDASPLSNDMFKIKKVKYCFRNNKIKELSKFKTIRYGRSCIGYQGAKLCNLVPIALKTILNFKDFKSALLAWNGPDCNCGTCFYCIL